MRRLTRHREAVAFARSEGRSQRRGAGEKGRFCSSASEQGQWGTVRAARGRSGTSPRGARTRAPVGGVGGETPPGR